MAPFIVLAPTNEAFAAAWEALGVTAEELLARDDLADILLNQPAGRHWTNQLEDTGYALHWKHDRSGLEAGDASVHGANRLGPSVGTTS